MSRPQLQAAVGPWTDPQTGARVFKHGLTEARPRLCADEKESIVHIVYLCVCVWGGWGVSVWVCVSVCCVCGVCVSVCGVCVGCV